jgi:hypothetical protein
VTPETATCPSCGAVLITDEEPDLPGVTAVDAKVVRGEKPPQRNRLLSWISGEYQEEAPADTHPEAIAPPDPDVQREIRRLEHEAEVANLQAEADALLSEAVVEGRVVEVPEGIRPLVMNEPMAAATEEAEASVTDVEPMAGDEPVADDAETQAGDEPAADAETQADDAPAAGDEPSAEDAPPA